MRDDLKNAIRSLCHSPTFAAVALTVLALGIGAATAHYSVADAVVLRGLPFDEHDRMMAVLEYDTARDTTFGSGNITPQTYLHWREQQQSFEGLAAVSNGVFRLRNDAGEPADARAQLEDPARENSELIAVLNEAAVAKYFPDQDPIGQRVVINNRERTIVGVVANIRHLGLESPVRHAIFVPYAQQTTFGMNLAIRTTRDPLDVLHR